MRKGGNISTYNTAVGSFYARHKNQQTKKNKLLTSEKLKTNDK